MEEGERRICERGMGLWTILIPFPDNQRHSRSSNETPPTSLISAYRFCNLPPALECITFRVKFNEPLPTTLPTHLTFRTWFNHPVATLPSTITHLTFGARFNQPVQSLPPSFTSLVFGSDFNQSPLFHLSSLV